jgi:hypothetical protein
MTRRYSVPAPDTAASDLELLECGRQEAAWSVVLTVVRETVIDHRLWGIE